MVLTLIINKKKIQMKKILLFISITIICTNGLMAQFESNYNGYKGLYAGGGISNFQNFKSYDKYNFKPSFFIGGIYGKNLTKVGYFISLEVEKKGAYSDIDSLDFSLLYLTASPNARFFIHSLHSSFNFGFNLGYLLSNDIYSSNLKKADDINSSLKKLELGVTAGFSIHLFKIKNNSVVFNTKADFSLTNTASYIQKRILTPYKSDLANFSIKAGIGFHFNN